MAETGNPNVRTNFKGKYSVTSPDNADHVCMLSVTNDVIFCDNYVSNSSGLIMTLPEDLRPNTTMKVPIVVNTSTRVITINTNGQVKSSTSYSGQTHYFNGFSFNLSGNIY